MLELNGLPVLPSALRVDIVGPVATGDHSISSVGRNTPREQSGFAGILLTNISRHIGGELGVEI
jgi:hypothetical protein